MKRALFCIVAALSVSGCAAISNDPTEPAASRDMKVAFDITDGNPKVVLAKLNIIDVTRKQLIESGVTPKMVLAFRGDASYFTQADLRNVKEADRADTLMIHAKLKELRQASGVQAVEQCNLPLAPRKLKAADVMQEVKVVPNGWISLVNYQRQGYGYIVP